MPVKSSADLWFDPFCPYAWITSRWLIEVAKTRPVEIRWHIMSLNVLNEGKEVPAEYRDLISRAIEPVRVAAAVERSHGQAGLAAFYTEFGVRWHDQGRGKKPDELDAVLAEALAAAGLEAALAAAAHGDDQDERIRASHFDGIDRVGQEVGTPVIAVDGTAFFGPVLTRIPRGAEAGRLWDGVLTVAGFEHFYELKRSRTTEPDFS